MKCEMKSPLCGLSGKSRAGRVQRSCGKSDEETIVVSVDFVSYFLGLRKKVTHL